MSLRIGLYDFFAYTLPGIFCIFVAFLSFSIFGVVHIDLEMLENFSLFSSIFLVAAGYFVGLLLDPIAFRWSFFFQKSNQKARAFAFEQFHTLHPRLKIDFEPDDWSVLLQAVKYKSPDLAMDIEQHNVSGILFRNVSFGLAILSAILLLFGLVISLNIWNFVFAGIAAYFSLVAGKRYGTRRHWFYAGVFEAFAAIYLLEDGSLGELKPVNLERVMAAEKQLDE